MNAPRLKSSDPGHALTCARTRHLTVRASTTRRFLPEALAGGSRSRPLFGVPLPLKSAQDLRGNVSNHYPSIRTVFTADAQINSSLKTRGARDAETDHPQILDKSSIGVANE